MFGNLVGKMLPTLAVGLCPSALEFTMAKYQTLGRKLRLQDVELLTEVGYTKDHVIESVFTSGLKAQTEHISRAALNLPENVFLMAVIGTRLKQEITDAFLELIESILRQDMYLVFWGHSFDYQIKVQKFPKLKKQSIYLGVCADILSRLELCDLYINPIRRGGGTSCVEALSKGVPVVTVDFGDVAVNAGEEFCVKDYGEMKREILRYYEDKEYYQMMSEKALKRAETLLDTDAEFVKILQEMERREHAEGN